MISDGIRVRVKCNSGLLARVGPGHCCHRIGLIHLLAGWHKRRPEPGLVWFHLVQLFRFVALCSISVSLVCLDYFAK